MARPSIAERAGPTGPTMGTRSCPAQGPGFAVLGPWAGWGGQGEARQGWQGCWGPWGLDESLAALSIKD